MINECNVNSVGQSGQWLLAIWKPNLFHPGPLLPLNHPLQDAAQSLSGFTSRREKPFAIEMIRYGPLVFWPGQKIAHEDHGGDEEK